MLKQQPSQRLITARTHRKHCLPRIANKPLDVKLIIWRAGRSSYDTDSRENRKIISKASNRSPFQVTF